MNLRRAGGHDLERIYEISLLTGHEGKSAAHLYLDKKLIGHIYSAPYIAVCPQICFVAEEQCRVVGFVVGAVNTREFERRLESDWWPKLRGIYPIPNTAEQLNWTPDQQRHNTIHNPKAVPSDVVGCYPSHLHMNLLSQVQRKGVGSSLPNLWLERARELGSTGAHVGVNINNTAGQAFWQRSGFNELPSASSSSTCWFGREL